MPKSLKDARNEGDLESFIKEHEKDAPGDLDKLEKTIRQHETYRSLGQSSWGCQTKSVKDSYRREADIIMDGRNED